MPTGSLAWLVTRWANVRFVLADARFGKAALLESGAPKARPGSLPPGLLMTTDPPEHSGLRTIVGRQLNQAAVARLRPGIGGIAGRLIVGLASARQPVDLVTGFAEPFAMQVICELLGVPVEDRGAIGGWAEQVLAVDSRPAADVEDAQRELFAYITGLTERRATSPGDDLISAMLTGGPGADVGTVVKLAATLLVTGYETIVAALANSVLTLLTHPGGMALVAGPAGRVAVLEELLRFATFGDALRSRRAIEDVEVGGVWIRRGDLVMVSTASANRDSAQFAEGDRFDPDRAPNRHLSFGRGIHHCVGAGLARAELEIALERLATGLPSLRLAVPPEEIVLRGTSAEGPPTCLPVTW